MTDVEFMNCAEALLQAVERNCDRMNDETQVDIDNQRTGGMVTLTFENRSQIIINLQKPLQEIWLAAKSGGYHYRCNQGVWIDTKGQGEFFTTLSDNASAQAGDALVFSS
jgi:CyaY protein